MRVDGDCETRNKRLTVASKMRSCPRASAVISGTDPAFIGLVRPTGPEPGTTRFVVC
jgi:hypothetical protein